MRLLKAWELPRCTTHLLKFSRNTYGDVPHETARIKATYNTRRGDTEAYTVVEGTTVDTLRCATSHRQLHLPSVPLYSMRGHSHGAPHPFETSLEANIAARARVVSSEAAAPISSDSFVQPYLRDATWVAPSTAKHDQGGAHAPTISTRGDPPSGEVERENCAQRLDEHRRLAASMPM